jgi:translation initiation factor IF-3
MNAGPKQAPKYEHRINEWIKADTVRLIGAAGEQVGVVSLREARRMAEEAGLDLVEIVATSTPPVCKIVDYGKLRYEAQKKEKQARKNQVVIEVKEMTLRPHIDDHDYQTKIRQMQNFLSEGDKVKVTLRFRGREMSHMDIGRELLNRIVESLKEFGKIESPPKVEGRNMGMMIASLTTKKSKASAE